MTMSPREALRRAAIPAVCAFLAALFVFFEFFATAQSLGSLQSLAPAETSSPRVTLEEFRANSAKAEALLMEAYRQSKAEPGLSWSPDVRRKVLEADVLLTQASRALDLRDIPPVELEHRRLEATLLLMEILDRVQLPDAAAIPDSGAGAAQPVASWNIPGTQIKIVRIADGPRAGEYLFSSETVQQLEGFYELVRHRPILQGGKEDFYDFFSQSPGHLLPPKWFGVIEALPPVTRTEVNGQAVWQWMALVLMLLIAGLGVVAIRSLVRAVGDSRAGAASLSAKIVMPAAVAVAALFVRYMADNQINLTGRVNDLVEQFAQGVAYLAMIWGVLSLSNGMAERLTLPRLESIDAHLARAAVRIAGLVVATVLLVYGASYLGIPLAGLLTGLGVGGLAMALAAKPTVENFIGGLILYADRPVRVGDLCRFSGHEGRVEEIGLRSTRVRGLDRTLITVPNATFVNMNIVNLTNRDRMPYERTITLQSTDSQAIRHEIEALAAVVTEHPRIEAGSVKTRLREGQEEAPKVEICALILTSQWDEFLQIQQEIDLLLRDKLLALRPEVQPIPADADNVVPLKDQMEPDRSPLTGLA
jgi:MscS family membrane protein